MPSVNNVASYLIAKYQGDQELDDDLLTNMKL
jgi:hypothetical protein